MKYIATFYSHFGAIRFKKECEKSGYDAKLRPVPRDLSSSCGTCVFFVADDLDAEAMRDKEGIREELEQIVRTEEDGYHVLYRVANS